MAQAHPLNVCQAKYLRCSPPIFARLGRLSDVAQCLVGVSLGWVVQRSEMLNAIWQTSTPKTIYLGVQKGCWSTSHAPVSSRKSQCNFRTCIVIQALEAAGNKQATQEARSEPSLCKIQAEGARHCRHPCL